MFIPPGHIPHGCEMIVPQSKLPLNHLPPCKLPPNQPLYANSHLTNALPTSSHPASLHPVISHPATSISTIFQSATYIRTSSLISNSHQPGVVIPMETTHDNHDSRNEIPSPSSRASTTQGFAARPVVYIINNKLFPENTSSEISKIFQKVVFPTGYNWKRVPANVKEDYFKEFAKVFTWAAADEVPIRNIFMKTAATRYRDIVSHWKTDWYKHKKRPSYIPEGSWDSWLAYWNEPETIAKSQKNSKNCRTGVEEGKGPSKHTGGSKSVVGHVIAMEKERGGVMPSLFEIQKRTHMRKDGQYVDERSKKVVEEVERQIVEASVDGDASSVDQNKIYLDVVGGVKKQRVYGLGSLGSALINDGQIASHSSGSSIDAIIKMRMEAERVEFNQKHEDLLRKLEEEKKVREQKIKEMEEDKQKMQEKLEQENQAMKIQLESQGNQLKCLLDSLATQDFSLSPP